RGRANSEWEVFRPPGLRAGVPALAWPSGSVREAVAEARRRAATDGLHSVAGRPPGGGVAGGSQRRAALMKPRYFSAGAGAGVAGAAAPAAAGAPAPGAPGPP